MRKDLDSLWLVYRDPVTGQEKKLPALDWIGQMGPINWQGQELELIGFEEEE